MKHRRIIPYRKDLVEKARYLRNNSTIAEKMLWIQLKGGRMCGYDFHRQKPIDQYIVDFFAPDAGLIIELDGESHDYKKKEDELRQNRLESFGLTVLRFMDSEVKNHMDEVVREIKRRITEAIDQEGI